MSLLNKIDLYVSHIEKAILSILLALVISITFWGVLDRFVFKFGTIWGEELARYTSIWAAFIGSGLGAKTGAHIGIEALVSVMPPKTKKILEIIANTVCLCFCIIAICISYKYIGKLMATNQLSSAMRIPVWWAYLAVPSGCVLMFIHYSVKVMELIVPEKNKG